MSSNDSSNNNTGRAGRRGAPFRGNMERGGFRGGFRGGAGSPAYRGNWERGRGVPRGVGGTLAGRGALRGNWERGRGAFRGVVAASQPREDADSPVAETTYNPPPPPTTMPASLPPPSTAEPTAATCVGQHLDNDLPPALWTEDMFPSKEKMDEAFYRFYEREGWVLQPEGETTIGQRRRFVPVVYDIAHGKIGTELRVEPSQAAFGSDAHQELPDIYVFKTMAEAEEVRKTKLAGFQEEIKGVPEGTSRWWKLHNQIKAYSKPMTRPAFVGRSDNEVYIPGIKVPFVDERKLNAELRDVRVKQDPSIETERRFQAAINSLREARLEDGPLPHQDSKWQAGTIWGPQGVSDGADDEDEEEDDEADAKTQSDRKSPSTFHGFRPRFNRPKRYGLGHDGYDYIFTEQRDGVSFSSKDVPQGPWLWDKDAPITFVGEDGSVRECITAKPRDDDPNLDIGRSGADLTLYELLVQKEKVNKGEATFQGRSMAGPSTQASGEGTHQSNERKPAPRGPTW